MAVLAVATLAGLAEFGRRAVAAICLSQVQADELRAIKLFFLPSKDAGDAAGNSCKNFHGAGYCEISANCTSNCSRVVHKTDSGLSLTQIFLTLSPLIDTLPPPERKVV